MVLVMEIWEVQDLAPSIVEIKYIPNILKDQNEKLGQQTEHRLN